MKYSVYLHSCWEVNNYFKNIFNYDKSRYR